MGAGLWLQACIPWTGPAEHQANQPVDAAPCRDPVVWYADADGDGYGDPNTSQADCEAPPGFVDNADDCGDADAGTRPGAVEIPYDGIDQDCVGGDACDVDGDGLAIFGVAACASTGMPATDCNDNSPSIGAVTFYPDADGDGYGDAVAPSVLCQAPTGEVATEATDCDDTRPEVHPGAAELVADQDDLNCDGVFGRDDDGDGYASIGSGGNDCNDDRAVGADAYPGAPDFVANGVDNNCDGIPGVDADDDGWASAGSGGPDCDDDPATGPAVNPAAIEVCNGIDDDCFGGVDDTPIDELLWYEDSDSDGFGDSNVGVLACDPPPGFVGDGTDCDDADETVYPSAPDLNDGQDNNCDGVPGVDADQDGYADLASGGGDCADADAARHPGAVEIPYDGIDQDCSGRDLCDVDGDGVDHPLCRGQDCDDDSALVGDAWFYPDADGDGYGESGAAGNPCVPVLGSDVTDDTDCDDTDPAVNPGASDSVAGGLDLNCDGVPGVDADGDGVATLASGGTDCDDSDPATWPGAVDFAADGIDRDCDGVPGVDGDGDGSASLASGGGDCDDTDPGVFPGAADSAVDGLDTNCDGVPGVDADGDGQASLASGGEDCNDLDPLIRPGATDFAANGVDNNCDGVPGFDADGDGFASVVSGGADCNDAANDTWPGAPELCDGRRTDCSASLPAVEIDDDGDGYVECDANLPTWMGAPISGGRDCDDTAELTYPGAAEACDGRYNDCDNPALAPDEIDDDGDGFVECVVDAGGWWGAPIFGGSDCDDLDATRFPFAFELCDGRHTDCTLPALRDVEIDDDGDGYVECTIDIAGWLGVPITGGDDCDDADYDEDPTVTWYADLDRDRFGEPSAGHACERLDPTDVTDDTDCDDSDPTVYPFAPELCDGRIQDCTSATLAAREADRDGDGVVSCAIDPGGWFGDPTVVDGGDCDDRRATVSSGAACTSCGVCDTVVFAGNSIQTAIDGAQVGDVVCVYPGTYVENLDFGGKSVCVRGTSGPASTVLDGGGVGTVVRFDSGEDAEAILEGFTLTNGNTAWDEGGGVHIANASPTLRNLVVDSNNSPAGGGGIRADNADLLLVDLIVSNNTSQYAGGGMHLANSEVTALDLMIDGNYSSNGPGGVDVVGGRAAFVGGVLSNNNGFRAGGLRGFSAARVELLGTAVVDNFTVANLSGGGVNSAANAVTIVDGAWVAGNHGDLLGGGLYADTGWLAVRNSTVTGNTARVGAGIYAHNWSFVYVWNTDVFANDAVNYTGGIHNYLSTLDARNVRIAGNTAGISGGAFGADGGASTRMENCTLLGNSAGGDGAALWLNQSSKTTVIGSVIAGNTAPLGSVASFGGAETATLIARYSDLWNNSAPEYNGIPDVSGSPGNLAVDPEFASWTPGTDPFTWDLHLTATSPLIDAGHPDGQHADPDLGRADIGATGGSFGALWDIDGDGYPEWWQPGPYDPLAYPAQGWDCDDRDPAVHPGAGC